MFLSIIILTKDRIKTLEGTLLSLLNQTLDGDLYEIIVMDQSTDPKVKELVEGFSKSGSHTIRYIFNNIIGAHSSRNIGVKKARGDIIVFVDDDIIADRSYLEAIRKSFVNDPDIALMTGKVVPLYEDKDVPEWLDFFQVHSEWGRYIWEISLLDAGEEYKEISSNLVFGCNFIIRKDIFIKYKGTHPDIFSPEIIKYIGSGETLLANKIEGDGLKVIYNPDIKINHRVSKERSTPEYFYYRNYIMGIQHSYDDIRKTGRRLPLKQIMRDLYFLSKNIFIISLKFYNKSNRINFRCVWNKFKGRMHHKWWVLRDRELFEFILRENYFDDGMEFLNSSG